MAFTTEQVFGMLGSQILMRTLISCFPMREVTILATTSADFLAPHNGTQEAIASSIEYVLSGIIQFFSNNTQILVPETIHTNSRLVKYDHFRWIFESLQSSGQWW